MRSINTPSFQDTDVIGSHPEKKGFSAENTAQNRPEFCRQSGLNAQKIRLVYDAFLQHFTGHREGCLILFFPVKLFLRHGCLLSESAPLYSRRGNNTSVSGSHSSEIPARNGRRWPDRRRLYG